MKAFWLTCSLAVLACAVLWGLDFRVNLTASMPRGVYRLIPGEPERGDRVSLCLAPGPFAELALERGYLRSGSCPSGTRPLLKRVSGLPGDVVALGPEGLSINGLLQPASRAATQDHSSRDMPTPTLSSGVIPPGKALVLSDNNPGGFDSRYFGLVPLADLHRVRAILTFDRTGD